MHWSQLAQEPRQSTQVWEEQELSEFCWKLKKIIDDGMNKEFMDKRYVIV